MEDTLFARVLLDRKVPDLDQGLHYHVPEQLRGRVALGSRVKVPLGKGTAMGYVIGLESYDPGVTTRAISQVADGPDGPILSLEQLELAKWMSSQYACLLTEAISALTPPGRPTTMVSWVELVSNGRSPQTEEQWQPSGPQQTAVLACLQSEGGHLPLSELRARCGKASPDVLLSLQAQGVVRIYEKISGQKRLPKIVFTCSLSASVTGTLTPRQLELYQALSVLTQPIRWRDVIGLEQYSPAVWAKLMAHGAVRVEDALQSESDVAPARSRPTLTAEQQSALSAIVDALTNSGETPFLLHGVTGSGKTEVYLQAIEACLLQGRQAIVLVPEISLTPQTVERFRLRFGSQVVVLHSSLPVSERYTAWTALRRGVAQVVVGARSAVFAPVQRLGLVIIDEEHENTYKQEEDPKYHAAEVALWRARYHQAVVVMGSATPSLESYHQAMLGKYQLLTLNKRVFEQPLPRVHVVDMRLELKSGWRSMFSRLLTAKLELAISRGEQAILFLNRRGFSRFALCRSCGETVACPHCEISLVQHLEDDRLRCHYCGYSIPLPRHCPHCGSTYLRFFGVGTEKVQAECEKLFPGIHVLRMDADTTAIRGQHEKIYRAFAKREAQILVGTQMVAKGLDFPQVTVVGVLAADSILRFPDYRAGERAFSLLTQVAGRAGRGQSPGDVVIQSYDPGHPSIVYACQHDYQAFYQFEIENRRRAKVPPFGHIAQLTASGTDEKQVELALKKIASQVVGMQLEVAGPQRAGIARIKDRWRWQMIAKSQDRERLVTVLDTAVRNSPWRSTVQLSLCIDPLSF